MGLFNRKKEFELYAPVNGTIISLEDVLDPVFSKKMMGDGLAITYQGGNVYAPISGTVSATILPSGHAFGICGENGIEILVHVGLETVGLHNGEFQLQKKQGDFIKAGELMICIDEDKLSKLEVDTTTPLVITNTADYEIVKKESGVIKAGDVLLTCRKR